MPVASVSAMRRSGLGSLPCGRSLPAGRHQAGAKPGTAMVATPPAKCTGGGVALRLLGAALFCATRRGPTSAHPASLARVLGSTRRRVFVVSLGAARRAPAASTTSPVRLTCGRMEWVGLVPTIQMTELSRRALGRLLAVGLAAVAVPQAILVTGVP